MKVTIQTENIPGKGDIAVFADEDGLIFGVVSNGTVQNGLTEQSREVRSYITQEQGVAYMKKRARELFGREDIDFIYQEAEDKRPQIVKPRLHM
jgi:xanthine/CO dehydrogenase XdhC/CoxF family maturation factor